MSINKKDLQEIIIPPHWERMTAIDPDTEEELVGYVIPEDEIYDLLKLHTKLQEAIAALKKYTNAEIYNGYSQDPVEYAQEALRKIEK
jgi:hypothetical protein